VTPHLSGQPLFFQRGQDLGKTPNENYRLRRSERLLVVVGILRGECDGDEFKIGAADFIAALMFTFSFAHTA